MLSRLLYHSFWNLYDHLGVLTLVGIGQTILLTAAVAGLVSVGGNLPIAAAVALGVVVLCLLLGLPLAGMLVFASKAAHGKPARLPDFLFGIRRCWGRVIVLLLVFAASAFLCAVNLRFYMSIGDVRVSRAIQSGAVILAGLHGWLLVLLTYLAAPAFCAVTAGEWQGQETLVSRTRTAEETNGHPGVDLSKNWRSWLRNALMALVLTPGLWAMVTLCGGALLVLALWSKFGLLLYLPIMVSVAQTAFFLSQQYAEFLAQAKMELGNQARLRALKFHARELALKWEYAQPRRTAKELIRPWE
jgi:hypothetical protein